MLFWRPNMQDFIVEEQRLGFGKCSLQVQVPEAGPIKSVDDLAGKRVVTSFEVPRERIL